MPAHRGQDETCEWSPLWDSISPSVAGLQICTSWWGGACCLSDRLSPYCLWQRWVLNIQRMAVFLVLVFGLLVCVLWWAFLKSYESLPVAHPTCLLSSFLHGLLFLSLICPPRLPGWILFGLTRSYCWSRELHEFYISFTRLTGRMYLLWMGWGSLFATGLKQRSCHPQHLVI